LSLYFLPLQIWWFLPPDYLKLPYYDVTVPVVADIFRHCHGFFAVAVVPVVAGIHLDGSFPALTAITPVADDQCDAVAGFLSLLGSMLLCQTMLLVYRTFHNVARTLAVPPFTGVLAIAVSVLLPAFLLLFLLLLELLLLLA
jgi:hypothetical protein